MKLPLPLGGSWAFLLSEAQAAWLQEQRRLLGPRLRAVAYQQQFEEIARWRLSLPATPLPLLLVERVEHLLAEAAPEANVLPLAPAHPAPPGPGDAPAR